MKRVVKKKISISQYGSGNSVSGCVLDAGPNKVPSVCDNSYRLSTLHP